MIGNRRCTAEVILERDTSFAHKARPTRIGDLRNCIAHNQVVEQPLADLCDFRVGTAPHSKEEDTHHADTAIVHLSTP